LSGTAEAYLVGSESLDLINLTLGALCIAIVLRGILSWIDPFERSQPQQMLVNLTEPIIAPFRRLIPPINGVFDISW
jgi:YggT family protein